jgi:hypothetical protein
MNTLKHGLVIVQLLIEWWTLLNLHVDGENSGVAPQGKPTISDFHDANFSYAIQKGVG